MSRFLSRAIGAIGALFRRDRVDGDLDDELHTYLEAAIERHMQAGLSREAATRAARIEIGSTTAVKDHVRDAGWESRLESVWRDLRDAVRMLRRSPGFTSVAVCSLALGLGATTAIFTLLNAILLRPLPVDHPEQLVEVHGARALVSFAMYRDLRSHQDVFTDMAVTALDTPARLTTTEGTRVVRVDNVNVSKATGGYFALLGLRPAAGRFFTTDEDRGTNSSESAGSVIVLSHVFWQRQFGGNPDVIGRTVLLDRTPCLVIGIAPSGALGRTFSTSERTLEGRSLEIVGIVRDAKYNNIREPMRPMFYVPLSQLPRPVRSIEVRTHEPVAPLIASIRQALDDSVPDVMIRRVVTLSDQVAASLSAERLIMRLFGFFGAAALLLACIGLYGVLAYSVTQRPAEIGVRLALGATRRAIMRLVLSDTATTVTTGIALGLVLAFAATRVLTSFLFGVTPTDARTFATAVTLLIATAFMAAWLPARRATRVDPTLALRD